MDFAGAEGVGRRDLGEADQGVHQSQLTGVSPRQALFVDIIARTGPRAIVETVTFLGAATELFSQTGLSVFTIELHPRNMGLRGRDFGASETFDRRKSSLPQPAIFSHRCC
jgi:hypothetical protein